ncbi:hypothetical protein J4E89_002498 [Alternaria sp. Ai002NY15]|nr:hypothetical protein J4E89_002498 [Alternaria sp. Ai002NY15]
MNPPQQYSVKVKEEYDELGIWVPVKQEQDSAESVPGAFVKDEPTDHKKKKAQRTEASTKRIQHVQRLEMMNSLLRKDLEDARDGPTAQRMRDLENQVLLLQGVAGPYATNILEYLKLENQQLQKRVDNVQREVDNAKRDMRAYNNGIEHKGDKAMIEALQKKLAQTTAQNESAVRELHKKLREEEVKRIRAEKRMRRADERLGSALGLMGHTAEEIVQYIKDDESFVEEQMR